MLKHNQLVEAAAKNREYKQLLTVLYKTHHARAALRKQPKIVQDAEKQLHESNSTLSQLQTKCKSNLKEHTKYRDGHARRFMYQVTGNKTRFAERATKREQEYLGALQALQHEHSRNVTLKQQVEDATKAQDELQSLSQMYEKAQIQLERMDLRTFAGELGSEFPEASDCEINCMTIFHKHGACRYELELETSAAPFLCQAAQDMDESIRHINLILFSPHLGLFGSDTTADNVVRDALAKSDRAGMQAREQLLAAQNASPSVERLVDFANNGGHFLPDSLFDNELSGEEFYDEVQRAACRLERRRDALRNELANSEKRRDALEALLTEVEVQRAEAIDKSLKVRAEAFEKLLRGRAKGLVIPPTRHDLLPGTAPSCTSMAL